MVRWRESGRMRGRSFDRLADARAFEAETRRRRQLGAVGLLDVGTRTLEEFALEWWRDDAEHRLAQNTLNGYAGLLDLYVMPRLGSLPLRELTPALVDGF